MPLDDLIKQDPQASTDLPTVEYIAVRCAALYIAFAKTLDNETQADRIRLKDEFKVISQNFFGTAINIAMAHKNKGTDAYIENVPHDELTLANIYMDRMNDARLRLGNGLLDQVVKADRDICQPMAVK
jgi:hypothetical protein